MKGQPSSPRNTIRVLVVDDHSVVREGLRTFLELQEESSADDQASYRIEVVGEASNGVEAVNLAHSLEPDIVLLDLVMPEMGGVEATPEILAVSPNTRVIILTSFSEEDQVIPAIRAGATGYLLKDIAPAELVRAIRQTHLGQVELHPEATKKLMSVIASQTGEPASQTIPKALEDLTKRELEVLRLVADGLPNRDIAAKLIISEKTVKTHVSNILSKLNLTDRTQAAIYAIRHGLAPSED